jgi:hypothetical protein
MLGADFALCCVRFFGSADPLKEPCIMRPAVFFCRGSCLFLVVGGFWFLTLFFHQNTGNHQSGAGQAIFYPQKVS